jgi:hypothetical protein
MFSLPPASAGFLLGSLFGPDDGGDVPLKRQWKFTGPHGVTSQQILLYIITVVSIPHLTLIVDCPPDKFQFLGKGCYSVEIDFNVSEYSYSSDLVLTKDKYIVTCISD